tara:strand:+ start:587 stop:1246 length:660 start_codon:yes stop_codon:yes gene_type:complete
MIFSCGENEKVNETDKKINKTSKRYKHEETSTSEGKVYHGRKLFNGIRYSEDKNGKKNFEQEYVNGIKHGHGKSFHSNGKLFSSKIYKNGLLISSECWDENGEEIICPILDESGKAIKDPPILDNYDFEQQLIELEEKNGLRSQLDDIIEEYNNVKDEVDNLPLQVNNIDNNVLELKKEIIDLLNNKNDLNLVSEKIESLNNIMKQYLHEIDSIFGVTQ